MRKGTISRVANRLLGGLGLVALGAMVNVTVLHALTGDTIADRELGQPDFTHKKPNTVDPEALNHPQQVAIDRSVVPNHVYVADSANHRILGYRSVAALASGASADLVIGQPDFFSFACGTNATSLCQPGGIAVDKAGNLFVADTNNSRVLAFANPFALLAAKGINAGFSAELVFGQIDFTKGSCNRGSGSAACDASTLCNPLAVAVDGGGNLYVADRVNFRVLEYDTPLVSGNTVADRVFGQLGKFNARVQNNGGISANSLFMPADVAVDLNGNLYVADQQNNRVLEYNTPLTVTAVHGSGDTTADMVFGQAGSFATNRCAVNAGGLCIAKAVTMDDAGDIFIADGGRVLEYEPPIPSSPVASRVFGQAGDFSSGGCNLFVEFGASPATLCGPTGLASDSSGDLYIADPNNNRVLGFSPPFGAIPVADLALGQPDTYHNAPNSVDPSGLFDPSGVAIDQGSIPNHLYVADSGNSRVLGYEDAASFLNGAPADIVIGEPDFYTSACNGNMTPSDRILCNLQGGVSVDQKGDLFVGDFLNSRVLEFPAPFESGYSASEPAITVFGQDGSFTTNSCNSASPTGLCRPAGVATDKKHNLVYVVDQPNNRVLGYANSLAANPAASVVIGQADFTSSKCNRKAGSPPAANTLCGPSDAAVDGAGNLFVTDTLNNRVLEYNFPIAASGASAARVFGQGGNFTSANPNKTGVNADGLFSPVGVAVDNPGNLYIVDTGNNRVLEYNTPLKATAVPGSGDTTADQVFGQANGFTTRACNLGNTTPSDQSLCEPFRVATDAAGNLYVSDYLNNRVLEFDLPIPPATPTATATPTPTRTPTPMPTPKPGTPVISSVPPVIQVGSTFLINGSAFSAGAEANFFVATSTGPVNAGPLIPSAKSATQLTIAVPPTVSLGQGFVAVQVVNTDKGFLASNLAPALLQGSAAAGIPSLTEVNGMGLAATSSDPNFATNNVETVVAQGATVKLGGAGFDTAHGVAVDLFCACPGGKVGPFFLNPGDPGLSASALSLVVPASGPNAPPAGPGSFVISNAGSDGKYTRKSNAVSVPIGARIAVTSVSQSGSTITVNGAGFSTLTVLNFFNEQAGVVMNLGGLTSGGAPKIPLGSVNENKITFATPAAALPGPAYVQALNPPFVPFSSSGNGPGGAFTLK